MSAVTAESVVIDPDAPASWRPMVAIGLCQVMMAFNVASLPVAMSGMGESFGVPPTTIATGIVTYSMLVAGFVMLGAKLNQRFGSVRLFRAAVLGFAAAQVLMTLSPSADVMIAAQGLCGIFAAVLVPALVTLIAQNYRGPQQATALGMLGASAAAAGVLAFLIGGVLGSTVGWRPAFALLVVVAIVVYRLSSTFTVDRADPKVQIDLIGVMLAALGIIGISMGFNRLNAWGALKARGNAPFDIFGLSPAPIMIVLGIVLLQRFLLWTRRRTEQGKTPLLSLKVLDSPQERAAVFCLFLVVGLEAMLNFSVPVYIQIVQGESAFATAIAMMPFNVALLLVAVLVVRIFNRFPPRLIGRVGFSLCAIGLFWLAWSASNNWDALRVMVGLVIFGIGQGALITLLFNVLVSSSPKELAGDVGSLRGVTNNLAAGLGTAIAGALFVSLLTASVVSRLEENPVLPTDTAELVDLDDLNFVSDDQLVEYLDTLPLTDEQVVEAEQVNHEARLEALKMGFGIMALVATLAILPSGGLPGYDPKEVPGE